MGKFLVGRHISTSTNNSLFGTLAREAGSYSNICMIISSILGQHYRRAENMYRIYMYCYSITNLCNRYGLGISRSYSS